jgi:hypothetical protein
VGWREGGKEFIYKVEKLAQVSLWMCLDVREFRLLNFSASLLFIFILQPNNNRQASSIFNVHLLSKLIIPLQKIFS